MWAIHKDPLLKKTEKSKHHACHLYVLQKKILLSRNVKTWCGDLRTRPLMAAQKGLEQSPRHNCSSESQRTFEPSAPHLVQSGGDPGCSPGFILTWFFAVSCFEPKMADIFTSLPAAHSTHLSWVWIYTFKKIPVFFHKFFAGHSLNISWFFMTFTARLDRSKMAQTKHISKTLYLKYPKICAQTQEGLTSSS